MLVKTQVRVRAISRHVLKNNGPQLTDLLLRFDFGEKKYDIKPFFQLKQ